MTPCKSTEVLDKSTGSSVYNGVFTLLNTSHDGRPVYRHERHSSLFFHYSQRGNCSAGGAWLVSDGLDDRSSTSMFAIDDAVDPMSLSPEVTWFVFDATADQFAPDQRLTVVCYVAS